MEQAGLGGATPDYSKLSTVSNDDTDKSYIGTDGRSSVYSRDSMQAHDRESMITVYSKEDDEPEKPEQPGGAKGFLSGLSGIGTSINAFFAAAGKTLKNLFSRLKKRLKFYSRKQFSSFAKLCFNFRLEVTLIAGERIYFYTSFVYVFKRF
ncbi:MAG: hypothetical protein K2W97_03260 [Chthoniobacterales bacterium]|nr:hypothetical protein [Chthoniobacterales bacterium]